MTESNFVWIARAQDALRTRMADAKVTKLNVVRGRGQARLAGLVESRQMPAAESFSMLFRLERAGWVPVDVCITLAGGRKM